MYGFNLKALLQDEEMLLEYNRLNWEASTQLFTQYWRVITFDKTVWETKYPVLNSILTYSYGAVYHALHIGTLLSYFSII